MLANNMATQDTCCTIVPYFKTSPGNEAAFEKLCERFVAQTQNEPKCLYYGFSFCGDQAFCREGYVDAEGVQFACSTTRSRVLYVSRQQ